VMLWSMRRWGSECPSALGRLPRSTEMPGKSRALGVDLRGIRALENPMTKNRQRLSSPLDRAITLASDAMKYWEEELSKAHPLFPLTGPEDKEVPAPKEEVELKKLLKSLPAEDVFKLVTLMYLGRGDFDVPDLPGQVAELKTTFESADLAIDQMTEKMQLGEYLAEARSCLNDARVSLEDAFSGNSKN